MSRLLACGANDERQMRQNWLGKQNFRVLPSSAPQVIVNDAAKEITPVPDDQLAGCGQNDGAEVLLALHESRK